MNRLHRLLPLLAVFTLVIAACGGGDGTPTTSDGVGETTTTAAADGVAEFTLFGSPTGVEGKLSPDSSTPTTLRPGPTSPIPVCPSSSNSSVPGRWRCTASGGVHAATGFDLCLRRRGSAGVT